MLSDQHKDKNTLAPDFKNKGFFSGKNSRLRVIAITSGKGGVGKTNIVANLAFSLSRMGQRAMILDADLGLGNLDVLLGLRPTYNLNHVLRGEKSISEIIIDGPEGIKILPAGSGVQEFTLINKEQKLLLLSQLGILREEFDLMLIDTAAGISSNVMYFNIAAQEIIVIVSPEPTSITDAYALMKVLSQRYKERYFKIIINNVSSASEANGIFAHISNVTDRFLNVSLDYLGYIFTDRNFIYAVKSQRLIQEIFPKSSASKCFDRLAYNLKNSFQPKAKGNIQFFWNNV